MILQQLNWLAIIVAGFVYFILGAMWYSPLLFAKPFIKYRGFTPEQTAQMQNRQGGFPVEYLAVLAVDLVSAFILALMITLAAPASPLDGILVGVLLVLGLTATSTLTYTTFSGPHRMLWVIYTAYQLTAFVIMSVILTVWR